MLKKEAEYFGDIVILPFIDRYELVVLKTIAICEYGVRPSLLSLSFVRLLLQLCHRHCSPMPTGSCKPVLNKLQ
jgi:hypothetical protein